MARPGLGSIGPCCPGRIWQRGRPGPPGREPSPGENPASPDRDSDSASDHRRGPAEIGTSPARRHEAAVGAGVSDSQPEDNRR
eukprot:699260-Hanusia_phi.AAC.1